MVCTHPNKVLLKTIAMFVTLWNCITAKHLTLFDHRTMAAGLKLTRPPIHIGRYKMVRHHKQWRAENGWDIYLGPFLICLFFFKKSNSSGRLHGYKKDSMLLDSLYLRMGAYGNVPTHWSHKYSTIWRTDRIVQNWYVGLQYYVNVKCKQIDTVSDDSQVHACT